MLETGEFYCREMESMRDPDSSETSTAREKKKGNIFVKGDAREMPFDPKSFDIVSSSYAIQYNAQGYQHRRDIEEILLQTNKVLKDEGYGILALPNQATSQEDIDALTESLLPRYGFEVKFADYITGHAIKETTGRENRVFQGFFLVVYQKKDNHTYLQGEGDVFVFSPYKKLGIGGIREIEMQKKGAQNYKTSKIPAETFKTSDKEVLRNSLRNAI